jgi:Reverse transcriptase (RNA-dependent DNA polymerase)
LQSIPLSINATELAVAGSKYVYLSGVGNQGSNIAGWSIQVDGTLAPITGTPFGEGYSDGVDGDLSKYFDTIRHTELLKSVARRIVDRNLLHLIKMWWKAPVEERDENGKRRMTGGRSSRRGTPQGGIVSPHARAPLYEPLPQEWADQREEPGFSRSRDHLRG